MNFLADESVDRQIVERLRLDGHLVWYVADMRSGITDSDVLEMANREESILLTADKDFGELVFRQKLADHGVVLIRLVGLPTIIKAETVASAAREHSAELGDNFTVIAPGAIRIRRRIV